VAQATALRDDIDEIMPGVVADRRDFHEHPELAFQEVRTASIVADRLRALGIEDVRTGIAQTGVTGLIHGRRLGEGKTVLLRADMDALPILEENDVDTGRRRRVSCTPVDTTHTRRCCLASPGC
jgi:amidohydrolase